MYEQREQGEATRKYVQGMMQLSMERAALAGDTVTVQAAALKDRMEALTLHGENLNQNHDSAWQFVNKQS